MLLPETNTGVSGHKPDVPGVDCNGTGEPVSVMGQFRLPKRRAESHKGDYGKLLIVGGSVGYSGAPCLCAAAAVRGGAGLVSLGVPEMLWPVAAVKCTEAMPFPLAADAAGRLDASAADAVMAKARDMDVLALGPGLGRGEGVFDVTRRVLSEWKGPLVLDADALWAVAQKPQMLDDTAAQVVLTPHEGEFARLWPDQSGERLRDAREYATRHRCTLVLKGHRTLIAFPDGRVYRIEAGNPGMASGGSGDVLTGVIAALLGQMEFDRAVITGCWLHARAGDIAAEKLGEYALAASDIIDALPQAELEIME